MFDHPIIDVALGLVFFYVVLSLFASAVQEWIASVCALRSKNLRQGIGNLVGDQCEKWNQERRRETQRLLVRSIRLRRFSRLGQPGQVGIQGPCVASRTAGFPAALG